ncbi:MAG TPA: phospholipid carrier-dependent glycosyltransferase [Pseudonocardiaceae bacterium]|nr:phospholipid carrier-dependent glycosyltransferase [Pseudonocardiaceae bacterium]
MPPVDPPPDTLLPDPAGTLGKPMPTDRLRGWIVTLTLTAIGAVLRFQNLGFPTDNGTPIFDEKHYVPQALQMLRNGGFEDNPGYELTVHPPLGKYLIAVGEWIFGYDGVGWRFASALAGTIMILLIIRIARRLTRSTLLGAIAGVLLICDGLSHLQSRMGMLDVFTAMWVLAAFACVLCDRDQVRLRLASAVREGFATESPYGPRLGFRWWRFACGVCLGLTLVTKWDGLYWIAAFGLLTVFWDWSARRAAGVARPLLGTWRNDVLPAIWALIAIALLVYLAGWWAWLSSETGVDRHAVGGNYPYVPGEPWPWELSWVPQALRLLLHYSQNVLYFHEHLVTPAGNPHPWESKPWTWPMGLRPMLYYYQSGTAACGTPDCVSATMLIGTPAMWWLAFPAMGFALWRAIGRFDWRYIAVLATYLAGILPWFLNINRQMYFFYMTPLAPFLVLMLVLPLGEILGRSRAGYERRQTGVLVVALYVGLVVANFAWLWPILNGDPISAAHWQAELWLPSWR